MTVVDVDPEWYAGQPETDGGSQGDHPPGVPTVLTKLQKWGDYEAYGHPVAPSRLIPMKTPLAQAILDDWRLPVAPRHRLTVAELLAAQAAAGRRVTLLLDLTNHDCLYDVDVPPGVQHIQVRLVAKELPPREYVAEVAAIVAAFEARQPGGHIAIHCSYGFNRTGFVVCCLLVELYGLTVDDALAAFAHARPPGVKHERFRAELVERYGGGGHRNASGSSSSSAEGGSAAGAPGPCGHASGTAGIDHQAAATSHALLPPLCPPGSSSGGRLAVGQAAGSRSSSSGGGVGAAPAVPLPSPPARCPSCCSAGDNSSIGASPERESGLEAALQASGVLACAHSGPASEKLLLQQQQQLQEQESTGMPLTSGQTCHNAAAQDECDGLDLDPCGEPRTGSLRRGCSADRCCAVVGCCCLHALTDVHELGALFDAAVLQTTGSQQGPAGTAPPFKAAVSLTPPCSGSDSDTGGGGAAGVQRHPCCGCCPARSSARSATPPQQPQKEVHGRHTAHQVLENESFGDVTSTELLARMNGLRAQYKPSGESSANAR